MKNLTQQKNSSDENHSPNRNGSIGCGMLLPLFMGVIFAIVGGCIIWFWAWPVLQKAKASAEWPNVPGTVTSAEVIRSRTDDGVNYKPEVLFNYTIGEEEYQQGNIRYDGDWSTNRPTHANKMVKKYKVGTEVTVYYDPDDPAEAVLEPGTTWMSYLPLLFGGVFFLVGSGLLIGIGGYLLFAGIAVGGAASGMIGKRPSSKKHIDQDNPYSYKDGNNQNDDDRDSYQSDPHDDGFENV